MAVNHGVRGSSPLRDAFCKMKNEITSTPYIEVKNSEIHHKGIFAKTDIPKKTKIIEYLGKIVSKTGSNKIADKTAEEAEKNSEKGSVYIFNLNKKQDIDGNVEWNTARLINHSCNPNCETEGDDEEIWITSIKDIKKGEEITYNYGYNLPEYEDHKCKCNSKNCVGYIINEEIWPKLFKKLKKKSRLKLK